MRKAGEPLPSKEESSIETRRRLAIIDRLTRSLGDIPEGMLLGGSMAWGQNVAVRETSDIDLSIFCPKGKIDALASTEIFEGKIPEYAKDAFRNEVIDVIWPKLSVDGIVVNTFIHNPTSHLKYCKLERPLNIFTTAFKPHGSLKGHGFDGVLRTTSVKVGEFNDGYTYSRPLLCNNEFYGNPVRADYLYCSSVISDKNNFIKNAEAAFWKSSTRQLKREYGSNPDLTRFNILNTLYVFKVTPGVLPKSIVNKIQERTKFELSKTKLKN